MAIYNGYDKQDYITDSEFLVTPAYTIMDRGSRKFPTERFGWERTTKDIRKAKLFKTEEDALKWEGKDMKFNFRGIVKLAIVPMEIPCRMTVEEELRVFIGNQVDVLYPNYKFSQESYWEG